MAILVTGGAGYIGTHTCVELLATGHDLVVLDNLSNSKTEALTRVEQISGKSVKLYAFDVRDRQALRQVFSEHQIESVIHFAGLKAVGESVMYPVRYYDCNVYGTIALLEVMLEFGVRSIVFSSSATVYGTPHTVPVLEDFPVGTVASPYAQSKFMVEQILRDLYASDNSWRVAILRYFNPVGAHPSGKIGEDPRGIPNNLMPYLSQVAIGRREFLQVFGNDYETPDGTGMRDYIHVVDLARGHVAALDYMQQSSGLITVNLGTGRPYSVLDMVSAFSKACGHDLPYRFVDRRPGDIACYYADVALAKNMLGWVAELDIDRMCQDSWHWQSSNPFGYERE